MSTQFDQLKKPSPKTLDQLIELLRNSGAALPSIVKPDSSDLSNPVITGVAYDSRAVKPGDIFISIEGMKQDGNAFIAQAIQNGASCIVSEKSTGPYTAPLLLVPDARKAMASLASALYEKPSSKLRVLGVTGTNGKTTTTHLIEHILNFAGLKTGLIGTLAHACPSTKKAMASQSTRAKASIWMSITPLHKPLTCKLCSIQWQATVSVM
ncbi:MAG: hypothetical protein IPL73_08640 [Candidatus Obscuribacter sp.]|nr:hypothetical protein [Candidatus Obscuribacter sp.]